MPCRQSMKTETERACHLDRATNRVRACYADRENIQRDHGDRESGLETVRKSMETERAWRQSERTWRQREIGDRDSMQTERA